MAKRKRQRLTNVEVAEVSLVDRPANLMPFLFVKRADGAGGAVGADSELAKKFAGLKIEFDTDGTFGGTKLTVNGKSVPDCTSLMLTASPKTKASMDMPSAEHKHSAVPDDDAEMGLYCSYRQGNRNESNGGFMGSFDYCLMKGDAGDMADLSKPYPNEHAARMADPEQYKAMRRQNNKMGPGIHAIMGVKEDGKTELQALRFDRKKFTADEAKAWLAEHDMKPMMFEPAAGKVKKAAAADVAAVSAFTGEDAGDTDGEVLAELAKGIATVELYRAALPPDLVAAVAEIAKLACECELAEVDSVEVAKMADATQTQPAAAPAPVDVKAIVEQAVTAALNTALPQLVKSAVEALRPAAPTPAAAPPPPPPAAVEDPEVTPEQLATMANEALAAALKT